MSKLQKLQSFLLTLAIFTMAMLPILHTSHAAKIQSIDKSHSSAVFTVTHLKFSRVNGQFKTISAEMDVDNEGNISKFNATAEVKSVDTENQRRDKHLLSSDFFDSNKYSTIDLKMVSTDANSMTVDLTIRETTKRVKFSKRSGVVETNRGSVFGISLETKINRMDFGVGKGFLAKVISEEVDIVLSFEASL